MTPFGLERLRIAATLAHAVPNLGIRVQDGDRLLLAVGASDATTCRQVGPCAFRATVGRAYQAMKAGRQMCFMDLPADADPSVELDLGAGQSQLGPGLYRLFASGSAVDVFSTTLDAKLCETLGATGPIRLTTDEHTEVTLVHAHIDFPLRPTSSPVPSHLVPSPLAEVLARCLAEELTTKVAVIA